MVGGSRFATPFNATFRRVRALCAGLALAASLATQASAGEITVFAAASLKNAMDEISAEYQQETGRTVTVSLASSSALARQIQLGAPADIFISASVAWMDTLEQDDLIDPASRFDLLGNTIVLIGHGPDAPPIEIGPDMDLAGILGTGHLAMALVDAAPAGIYGKAALETLGQWATVQPRVAQGDTVRAALALVSRGEAPLGVVYATDAAVDDNVTVVGTFPAEAHPPIIYPAAAVSASGNALNAAFLEYLRGPAATEAFDRQGFATSVD